MSNNDGGPLPAHNRRTPFERLVCEEGLGYCCPFALFRVTKETGKIATRLGMTGRTVQIWKARFRNKEIECEHKANCLLPHIRSLGK